MKKIEFKHNDKDWQIQLTIFKEPESHDFVFESTMTDESGDTHSFIVISLNALEVVEVIHFLASNETK